MFVNSFLAVHLIIVDELDDIDQSAGMAAW
jgi:hypothetical protein